VLLLCSKDETRAFGNNITNTGQNEALPITQDNSTASKSADSDTSTSPAVDGLNIRDPCVLANIRLHKLLFHIIQQISLISLYLQSKNTLLV
jgi:hypothetical protein